MNKRQPTRQHLIQLLSQHPDGLTMKALMSHFGRERGCLWDCIRRTREKTESSIFRIARYERNKGTGGRPQPVWTLGPGEDAEA